MITCGEHPSREHPENQGELNSEKESTSDCGCDCKNAHTMIYLLIGLGFFLQTIATCCH